MADFLNYINNATMSVLFKKVNKTWLTSN